MNLIFSICVGIALSAACGFRVFVPMLVMSIAAKSGHLGLNPEFQWIGTWYALTAFAVATGFEIAGYYIPWVDNMLDWIMTPVAVIAGILASASLMVDAPPFFKWSVAIIAGGGAAGAIQGTTVVLRGASTATTAGLGNPALATVEWVLSTIVSALAVLIPMAMLAF